MNELADHFFRHEYGRLVATLSRRVGVRHLLANVPKATSLADAAAAMVVLHATDPASVHLEARARMAESSPEALERELYEETTVLRMIAMRRTLFGETDATVNRKIGAAFAADLAPIVCIGETLDQRERNETLDVLDRQIRGGLDGVTAAQLGKLVLAYEPVWAIGTGRNATPAQAGEAHAHIRQRLRQWFGAEAADLCRVIYGGSVKPENISELAAQPDVDGALVGGASLDVKAFYEILRNAVEAFR